MHFEFSLVFLGMILMIGAVIFWLGWIRDYIRHNGERPSFVLLGWSPLVDYRKARRVAKRVGHTPWFLRSFEVVMATVLVIGIVLTVLVCIDM